MFVYVMHDDASSTKVSPDQVIWLDKSGCMSADIQYNSTGTFYSLTLF